MDSLWIDKLLSKTGYDYLCRIDDEYLRDKFNLTGLEREVSDFKHVYDSLFQKNFPPSEHLEAAIHLYGLIHSRYILSSQGLSKMHEKYNMTHFGVCPRILCGQSKLLPVGLSERYGTVGVKLYCPVCEDVYSPKSPKHNCLDGFFFGPTFPHLFLLTYPIDKKEYKYSKPSLFGFGIQF